MLEPVLRNPWVQAIALLAALALVVLLAYFLSFVLVPLFLAFLAAYVLDPVVDFFEKRGIPRGAAIGVLAVAALLVAVITPVFVAVNVVGQADMLIRGPVTETSHGDVSKRLNDLLDKLPLDEVCALMGWGDPQQKGFSARAEILERIGVYVKANAAQFVKSHALSIANAGQSAGQTAAQVVSSIGRGIVGLLVFVANCALFAFVAGYLLKDFDGIVAATRELVPLRHRGKVAETAGKIDAQLRGFLRGQLTVALCLGMMYGVGMFIAGTPFAFLIAVLGVVAGFIPYFGVMTTAGLALLLTLLQYGINWHIVAVILTFAVAQALEANLLTPRIVGGKVGLNPVWVILSILVFGNVLGFMGLLLAVPLAATLKVLVVELVHYYKSTPLFERVSATAAPEIQSSPARTRSRRTKPGP